MSARNADRRTPRSAALRRLIAAGNLLAAAARGHTTATPELAGAWDNAVETLRADLAEPRVTDPRMRGFMRGLPSTETIGTCERCGATDHHLVLGLCPGCTDKIVPQTIDCSRRCVEPEHGVADIPPRPFKYEEAPLGAEADVSHLRLPKGGAR
jgi:hypothetical protein